MMMLPATGREITDVAAALLTHAAATGIKVDNPAALKAVWESHCRDMPATLLATGLAEVLKYWTNTFCLPSPGAVWDQINARHVRMCSDLAAMEKAQAMTLDADSQDAPDRAPSAETDRMLAETLKILKGAGSNFRRIA